jgi:alpha-ribazole phosphatase
MTEIYRHADALDPAMKTVHVWRHPKAMGVAGRCIGHADVEVMPRKARRLAHRIRRFARVNRLPACVWTSDLQRSLCVGRVLAGWGWIHRVDRDLREVDFGRWDGLAWGDIPFDEVDAWSQDLLRHAPGGGESVAQLLPRVSRCLARLPARAIVVGHGGWISAASWQLNASGATPTAMTWPGAPRHGRLTTLALHAVG